MSVMDAAAQRPGVMSLSLYTQWVSYAVSTRPEIQGVWVTAEFSDLRVNGGHCYVELIEKNANGQTVAKMRATIWAGKFQELRRKFHGATGRDIATGLKVMVRGTAAYHSLYGMAFNITDIDPSYTLGDMERLRREILMRLHTEGVLGLNKGLRMPPAPQRIAIISAEGAAGYGDFMNQLTSNREGFRFYPKLFPAVMQGDRTSQSVRAALTEIAMTRDEWDCVAIIRGGGATTDLNGFDDYDLARAVATFPLPVVVGIGHERDRTVLDEIAHTRMKTPTAVAAFFIDALRDALARVTGMVDWIARYSSERLAGEARRLANCEAMIPALVQMRFSTEHQKLDNLKRLLRMASEGCVKHAMNRLDNLAGLLDVLSPENTLRRGYSITRINGRAATDASLLKPGDEVTTRLCHGEVKSRIL